MIGKTLAHYEVTEQIGAGGMGEVFRARDTKLDRDVALKLLPESFAADAERLSRFEREAKLLAALNHPNIAAIYGIELFDSQRFLVLELVEGVDLAQRLAEGPLIVEDALAIAYQIAEAMEAAHEQGVVHRDLKPANVRVTPGGTVKVLDFGLAKALETDASSDLSHSPTVLASSPTMQGVILGTAGYMSPEQARGKAVDRRTDIWAFGVVLYEMLTARQLFAGETVSDVLASVIKGKPDWDALPEGTHPAIIKLLERCLDKDAKTRLRDIGEARIIIDKVLRGEISDDVASEARPGPSSSRTMGWIGATVIVAALAAAAGWFFKPGAPEPRLRKFSLPVESETGASPFQPRISLDGAKITYVLDRNLFVHELVQLNPRELRVEDNPTQPFWSPDGMFIGYVADGQIWKVPTSGGASVKVCDPEAGFVSGAGATWSVGDRIFYTQGNGPIFEVSANGGDPQVYLALGENDADYHDPSLLPDDKGIMFVAHGKSDSPDKIELFAGGQRKLLVHVDGVRLGDPRYASSGHIIYQRSGTSGGIWAVPFSLSKLEVTGEPFPVASESGNPSVSRDGTLVYLRGAVSQQIVLAWVGRDGVVSDPISAEARPGYFDPAVSPDGRRLAVAEWDGEQVDVWIHDLERPTQTRFTFSEAPQWAPEWTPDGLRVLYTNVRTGSVMIRNADGTGEPSFVTKGQGSSLSRDGKYMVYTQVVSETQDDLWYLEFDGASEPKPFLVTPAREYHARISPDGSHVAYASNESGDFHVYIKRFPGGGGKWQVATGRGGAGMARRCTIKKTAVT